MFSGIFQQCLNTPIAFILSEQSRLVKNLFFNEWLDILLYRKKPAEIAQTGIGDGIKNLVIAGIIYGLIAGIESYVVSLVNPAAVGVQSSFWALLGVAMIPFGAIMVPISYSIFTAIGTLINHVFCLLLGGKGDIGKYIGSMAKIYASFMGTFFVALSIIGIIVALAGGYTAYAIFSLGSLVLYLVINLWLFVLMVLTTAEVQKLSLLRTIIAIIVVPVAIILVLALLFAAFIFAIIAMAAGGMTGRLLI